MNPEEIKLLKKLLKKSKHLGKEVIEIKEKPKPTKSIDPEKLIKKEIARLKRKSERKKKPKTPAQLKANKWLSDQMKSLKGLSKEQKKGARSAIMRTYHLIKGSKDRKPIPIKEAEQKILAAIKK